MYVPVLIRCCEVSLSDSDVPQTCLQSFCVSSKAYQKLCERFKRDPKIQGFSTTEHTSIPALQEYAARLTLATREELADDFINQLRLLMASVRTWAQGEAGEARLSLSTTNSLKNLVEIHAMVFQKGRATLISKIIKLKTLIARLQCFKKKKTKKSDGLHTPSHQIQYQAHGRKIWAHQL